MAIIQLVMDKGAHQMNFWLICQCRRWCWKDLLFHIICSEMAIFQLVMDKCCSSDEFFDLTYTANGKRQIQVENISNRKWADKNSSYMDKKLGEATNLCVEIMSSRRQAEGKIGHVVQIRVCRLTKTWNLYFDLRKRALKLPYLSPS